MRRPSLCKAHTPDPDRARCDQHFPTSSAARSIPWLLVALLALLLAGCDSGAGGVTGPSGLGFLFDVSNIWFVETEPAHEFNLVPTSPASETMGTFDGDETLPSGEDSILSGSFSGSSITFTVQRAAGNVTFSGTIVSQNRLEVAGGGTSLVIIR